MKRFQFVLFLTISILLPVSYSFATQLLVPSNYATIQEAIDAASNGDEVVVNDGTYSENINFGGKAITVTSVNGPASTTIDGGGSGYVVTFENSEGTNSVLDGFTIQNGATGIYGYDNVSPTISNCIITNNTGTSVSANIVGGVYGFRSSFTMTNCTITNNTGWALFNNLSGLGGSLTMTGCQITANDGGVLFTGANLDVSKSIFTNNSNTGLRFSLTASGSGTGAASITNSLFAQNDSQDRAGGIWVVQATSVDIMNCTIADNTAQIFYGAGGIYVQASSTPLTITNSILTGNQLQGINNFYHIYPNTYQSNFDISYTQLNQSLYSDYGPGNISTSVWFVDSANGDYHLASNSYNIDAGTNSGAPADDLDGNSRPQNGVYDMGPYEFTCPPDGDGDGYFASEGCGNISIDCNDSNASIHPGKAENCSDGVDNDCDGLTDSEELDCTLFCDNHDSEETGPDYSCSTGKWGSCYSGTRTCSNNKWSDCNQIDQPATEICDNLDNDCDGRFNEGLNLNSCDTGLPGECSAGITRCQLSNTVYSLVCDPLIPATSETCDGLDNDCDGTVDNDVSTACSTGLPGICTLGTITCDVGGEGTWGSCIPDNQPVIETCDGIDNDCDGDIDEGFDSDGDGTPDCSDGCPSDPNKSAVGQCGCGVADTDTDSDGTADCVDECPADPNKVLPGICSCGISDCPQLPIIDTEGNDYDWFGSSVAISDNGTLAVIGATGALAEPDFYGNEFASGRVYIYKWDGSAWLLQEKLKDPKAYSGNLFGSSVSLSGDGTTILVGASRSGYVKGSSTRTGSAYIYIWNGSTWTLQATLMASDAAHYDDFGVSTALSYDGNTAVIGAPGAEESGDYTDRGAAYVFVRNGTTWTQQQRLKGTAHNIAEKFGRSAALSDDGNTLIIGAEQGVLDPAEGYTYYGLVYVLTRSESVWTQEYILRASDYILYKEKFGASVSISGDGNTALIGKPGINNVGSAYLFTRTDTTWSEHQKISPSDSTMNNFGISVSLSGDAEKAIIGANTVKTNGDVATGAAYVFTNNGTTWSELHKHFSEYGQATDYYGIAVAISDPTFDGFTALAGASLDDVGGHLNQGAVYVISTIIDSINPTRGATDVPVNTDITITFDQTMNGATFDDTSFTLLNGGVVSGIVNYDDGSKTATFTPLSLLTNSTRYIAGLTGVEDATGNVMPPFYWSFTTIFIDTDNDGLPDTIEDTNQNGIVDIGETDPNNPDTDGDGLSDGFEDANYNGLVDNNETDPRNFDSDGDGLNDGLEVNTLGTDPTLADSDSNGILDGDEDSDGDGFTNTEEIQCGSDPADPNSKCVTFLPFLMLLLD